MLAASKHDSDRHGNNDKQLTNKKSIL